MANLRASQHVYRDALTLSALGKRRLFRALCRAIIGNATDPLATFKDLRADLLAVAGEVRRIDHHTPGDTHDRDAR